MNVTLTAEERQSFEKFYNTRLLEAGGGRTFADDARIVRDMLRAVREDGMTPAEDGGISFVRRGGLDWRVPGAVESAQAAISGSAAQGVGDAGQTKDMLVGLGVLLAVILGAGWYFGGFSFASAADNPATPSLTVTPNLSAATPTPIPTLEADLLDVSGGVKTNLVTPRTLEIRGVSFVVQPVKITNGAWQLPDDPRAVSWVYGTVVNYVFGVAATAENKTLLAKLRAGDEIVLRMSTGPAYRFAVADTVRVSPQASEIFRQNRPGLTLLPVGDETQATRIAIRAVYLPDSELGYTAARQEIANPGDRVAWHDTLQITVLGSHLVPGHNPPADYRYLAVDVALKNVTARRLDTTPFQSYLLAGGVLYAAAVGLLGKGIDYPPLPSSLRPDDVVTTTLVYAVPETLLRSGADWVFSPDGGNDGVRVALPPLPDWQPRVAFPATRRLPDGTLVLTVTVTAPLETLTVAETAFTFDGGALTNRDTFPRQIAGGSTETFTLTLQPAAETVRVQLFDTGVAITIQ